MKKAINYGERISFRLDPIHEIILESLCDKLKINKSAAIRLCVKNYIDKYGHIMFKNPDKVKYDYVFT